MEGAPSVHMDLRRGCLLVQNKDGARCRHCSMACGSKSAKNLGQSSPGAEDSSESDGETEPAKSFHRRLSTNREIKCSVCLMCEILPKSSFLSICIRIEKDGMRAFVYFGSRLPVGVVHLYRKAGNRFLIESSY